MEANTTQPKIDQNFRGLNRFLRLGGHIIDQERLVYRYGHACADVGGSFATKSKIIEVYYIACCYIWSTICVSNASVSLIQVSIDVHGLVPNGGAH